MSVDIRVGDCRELLAAMPDESVHCVVTSPPYWGLRAYTGDPGMIGLEPTFDEHLENIVAVFREVRRVLRKDGTCWLNYGDAYANDGKWGGSTGGKHAKAMHGKQRGLGREKVKTGFKPKDLMMMPARVAMALQADGWWLRSEIVWHKSNPMPESCQDRPTMAHDKVFLLAKSTTYFYDIEAVKEPVSGTANARTAKHNTAEARRERANPSTKSISTRERRGITPKDTDGRSARLGREPGWRKRAVPPSHENHEETNHRTLDDPKYDHRLAARAPGVSPKSAPAGSGIRANESMHAAGPDVVAMRNLRNVWSIPSAPFPRHRSRARTSPPSRPRWSSPASKQVVRKAASCSILSAALAPWAWSPTVSSATPS